MRNEIRAFSPPFSHQEFNRPDIVDASGVNALPASGGDLFGRRGFA